MVTCTCGQENRDGSKYCLRCGARLDADAATDPLIGRVLSDRYRVVKVIAEGGMGRVYLAEQQLGTASREVAVKVLHATHSRDETLRQRFYRECEVVAHLTHPNTIQFYDFGELDDGRLFIVMEYIDGRSLASVLAEGALPLPRAEHLVKQIVGSLAEAHAAGVVHRDLKPDNILLTTRGGEPDFVKVCDFGIAKRDGRADPSLTLQGTVVGTPQYMSPEQLTGGHVDPRSDVYALGLIVYEMISGARPFTARSPAEWAAKHTAADPTPLEEHEPSRDLPAETKRAVMRALAKLPDERPPTVRAFAAELLGQSNLLTPIGLGTMSTAPREIDPSGPTQHASPAALRKVDLGPAVDVSVTPTLPPARSPVRAIGLALGLVGVVGAGAAALVISGVLDPAPPPVATVDAGTATTVAEPTANVTDRDAGGDGLRPREWLRIVHFQREVTDAALALGPPDDRYAVVRPRGTLVLELNAGVRIATDGTAGPDFLVRIDDARSGPYRLDVGVARNRYTTVGSELVGSLPLDADQFDIRRVRYVRLKNRGSVGLYVDSVGAYRTAAMDPNEAP
jgi:serine/threonine-protein kinase